jgi:hypothetical protein
MPRCVFVWSLGDPDGGKAALPLAEALPPLPPQRPLGRSAEVVFCWGDQMQWLIATAGELVPTDWGTSAVTWLHLKAAPWDEVRAGEAAGLRSVLVPVRYVVGILPGPAFTPARFAEADLAAFPPTKPTPAGALPLAEVERVLAELLAPELN